MMAGACCHGFTATVLQERGSRSRLKVTAEQVLESVTEIVLFLSFK